MIKMREKLTDQESEFKALEQEQLRKRGDVDHYDKQLRERQYHAQQCKNQIGKLRSSMKRILSDSMDYDVNFSHFQLR